MTNNYYPYSLCNTGLIPIVIIVQHEFKIKKFKSFKRLGKYMKV